MKKKVDFISLKICREKTVEYESKGITNPDRAFEAISNIIDNTDRECFGDIMMNNANEINYQAFGIDDTEYHDVLYGYIEAAGWMNDYKNGRATVTYNRQHKDGSVTTENICLSEKIRHIIHHPENPHNLFPSTEDIKDSINQMRDFIKNKRGIV